jgi:hypothetical protein
MSKETWGHSVSAMNELSRVRHEVRAGHIQDVDHFSIDCLALTRLDKSPRGGAKQKRIQTVLHKDDDLVCEVSGAHIKDFVRRYFLDVRVCFHLIQPLRFADFNSRSSRKLTSVITHGSFGTRVVPCS